MQLKANSQKIHMYIANEEVVCDKEINIVEQLNNTNTAILNNCYPLSWEDTKEYNTKFYMPKDYSLFKLVVDYIDRNLITEYNEDILTESSEEITIGDAQTVIFLGVIKRSKEVDLRPTNPHYATLQVLDMKTFISEGDLFNFVLTDTTLGDAIEFVINKYSQYNFTVGNLNLGNKLNTPIGNYNCNQKTLYDVLEYFAQISQSVWTTRYISDTEIAIDFYELDRLPQGQDLIYSTDFCNRESIINISYSINATDYRNKQIMTSSKIIANALNSESFVISGENYKAQENIAQIVSATLNGQTISIATTADQENGETADLYYKVGTKDIILNQKELPGHILSIKYYPQIPGRQTVINQDEITRINNQLNNSGVIARYENREDADTSSELNNIGQSYIRFKGRPEIILQLKTINNDMYDVGNLVYFDTQNIEGLEDLVGTYAVKKKTIQIIQNNSDGTNYTFYLYELSNTYNFESEVNFFDNQRAKIIGNIKEGEYINRYEESYKNYNIIFSPPVIDGGE